MISSNPLLKYLTSHTTSTASLSSGSFDSMNKDIYMPYIPESNEEREPIQNLPDIPVEEIYEFEPITYDIPVHKQIRTEPPANLMAVLVMVVGKIHNHTSKKMLRVLFDSGGMKTMIHRRALPPGVNPMTLNECQTMSTLAGI